MKISILILINLCIVIKVNSQVRFGAQIDSIGDSAKFIETRVQLKKFVKLDKDTISFYKDTANSDVIFIIRNASFNPSKEKYADKNSWEYYYRNAELIAAVNYRVFDFGRICRETKYFFKKKTLLNQPGITYSKKISERILKRADNLWKELNSNASM